MNNNIIFLDVDEVSKTTEKLEVIVKDEKLSSDNIKVSMESLNLNYKSDNSNKLNDLSLTIDRKLKTISSIHDNNILVLRKNRETYIATSEKVSKMFEDLG